MARKKRKQRGKGRPRQRQPNGSTLKEMRAEDAPIHSAGASAQATVPSAIGKRAERDASRRIDATGQNPFQTSAEERLRAIFGLNAVDPLPEVNQQSLLKYYRYLSKHVSFPLPAQITEATRRGERKITGFVVEVVNPWEADQDELRCIFVGPDDVWEMSLAEVEPEPSASQALDDYCVWLNQEEEGPPRHAAKGIVQLFAETMVFGAVMGTLLGSVFMTLENALTALLVGAVAIAALSVLVHFLVRNYGNKEEDHTERIFGKLSYIRAMSWGALIGAVAGALIVAYQGTIPGVLLGMVIGWLLENTRLSLPMLRWAVLGSTAGGVTLSFLQDWEQAWTGAWVGAILGAVAGFVALIVLISLALWYWKAHNSRSD